MGAPRLTWVFKYGDKLYGDRVLSQNRVGTTETFFAEKSQFLHPMISFYLPDQKNHSMSHYMQEDIYTHWAGEEVYLPLVRFIAKVFASVTGNPEFEEENNFHVEPHLEADVSG